MVNINRILKGNSGFVWLNGELLANVKKIEAKISGDFEDINFCGDNATYSLYNGWSGEGTLVLQKIDSKVWAMAAEAYKTGIMPEITIISALKDKSTGQSERASISQITITEFNLFSYEAKTLIEEEFPFKFANYDVLDKIA